MKISFDDMMWFEYRDVAHESIRASYALVHIRSEQGYWASYPVYSDVLSPFHDDPDLLEIKWLSFDLLSDAYSLFMGLRPFGGIVLTGQE